MENAEVVLDKYLQLSRPCSDNNLFLLTLNHQENKFWINEFNLEKSLQALPLKSQISVKAKKILSDRCMVLGSKFLQIFGIWLMLTQNFCKTDKKPRITLESILENMESDSLGKPSFNLTTMKQNYKVEKDNFNFSFSMSNDKESRINSMVIITSNTDEKPLNIGLDLINKEILDKLFIDEIKEGVLHPDELKLLNLYENDEKKYAMFFSQVWSLKESYSKYKGTGLINLDLKNLNFKNIKLIELPETENSHIELFINGEKQSHLTIFTKLFSENSYYSVVFNMVKPHEKIELKPIPLDIMQVDTVIMALACKPLNS